MDNICNNYDEKNNLSTWESINELFISKVLL